jgi:hypothetical protein
MISLTSAPLCPVPPSSPYCHSCTAKGDCPNTDTGPEEPILEQYMGFYTDTSTIGNFTLNYFAQMTFKQFSEMGYANETVIEHFFRLQDEIRSVISAEA